MGVSGRVVLAVLLGAWPCSLAAQTALPSAGQLTPQNFAPQIERTPQGIVLPGLPTNAAPAGADKLQLKVGNIAVEGGDAQFAAATEAALAEVRGRQVSVAELYAAAARIERDYAAGGYFLTRVVIPPQTVKPGGTLRLVVVEGFIESISADALAPRVRDRVSAVLAKLVGRKRLTLEEFERALLIAGDAAGLDLKTSLTSGQAVGSVRLVLAGSYRPVTGEIATDNSLARALGPVTSTTSLALNSLFGFGEQFYLNASGAPSYGFLAGGNPRRLVAAGVTAPLGPDGLIFNLEHVWSETKPHVDDALVLPTESIYSRWSARFLYPLIRDRSETLTVHAGLDLTSEKETAPTFATELYQDRLRIFRAGFDFSRAFETGTDLSFGGDLSQGLPILDSRGGAAVDPPVSRPEGSDTFTKLEARFRIFQQLPASFALEITGRGQYAGGPLMNSEQFSLGGPRALSAYDAAEFSGDHGWLLRGELQYAYPLTFAHYEAALVPYGFGARGEVSLIRPTAAQLHVDGASSFGVGARVTLNDNAGIVVRQVELGVEGARGLSENPQTTPDEWRFNAYGSIRF
jgi:hemolysin activation/secretion protein